jgi:hypothetical protein
MNQHPQCLKSILFLLLAILFSQSVPAQIQDRFDKENFFRFGFKAGVNLNKMNGKSFKDEFSYNYQLGGFVQINLTRKFGLQPEINFAQVTAEQSDDITDIYDDIFLDGEQKKARLEYLKLAGLFNLNVGPSLRVKLQLGPQWGLLLQEAVDSLKSPGAIFKKGEFSLLGGLWLQLPFVHIGTRYELGLTNLNDIDNQDRWRRQSWQFFAGITF